MLSPGQRRLLRYTSIRPGQRSGAWGEVSMEDAMADLIIDEESRAALEARLASPEGRAAIDRLAGIITESFVRSLPRGIDSALDTPQGMAALREAWPQIVDAFLFRRGPESTAAQGKGGRRQKPTS